MKERLVSIGGIILSFLSAVCCMGPFVLVTLGIAGMGMGLLSKFEFLRPYLLIISFISLGISLRYAYGKGGGCRPERTCGPRAKRINRVLFWVLFSSVVFGAFSPYAVTLFQK